MLSDATQLLGRAASLAVRLNDDVWRMVSLHELSMEKKRIQEEVECNNENDPPQDSIQNSSAKRHRPILAKTSSSGNTTT